MSHIHLEVWSTIEAAPEKVYAVLADYHLGHPAILPSEYFKDLRVEEGGQGAGTVVRVRMSVMGVKRDLRLRVSEPEPGRVLVEADEEAGVVTTFTVDPLRGGEQSRVTIATDARISPGLKGLIERMVNPAITRRIYSKELQQLGKYVLKNPDPPR